MYLINPTSDRARVRVLDPAGELRYLVNGDQAQTILKSKLFRAVRRRGRMRAVVPLTNADAAAVAAILADLEGLLYESHAVKRCGLSHSLGDNQTPPDVVTISRIPKSLRPIFTAVVDSCSQRAA